MQEDERFAKLPIGVQSIFEELGAEGQVSNESVIDSIKERARETGWGGAMTYRPTVLGALESRGAISGARAAVRMSGLFDMSLRLWAPLWGAIDAASPSPSLRFPREVTFLSS